VRGHRDLEVAAAGSAVCAALALLLPLTALRILFAAPLALLLPGYAIAAAAFGARPTGWQRTLVLSLGLSLATLALGGLALNYVPGGIRSGSWALLLVLVALSCCRVAALRRPSPSHHASSWPRLRLSRTEAGLVLGGSAAAAIALALAFATLPAKNALGYTELWISPTGGRAAAGVQIGVSSDEQSAVAYLLQVRLGRSRPPVIRHFTLNPAETHTISLGAAPPPLGTLPVTALLFRQDDPSTVYRRVSAWVPARRTLR
jgi:uncharacterized membrane protein